MIDGEHDVSKVRGSSKGVEVELIARYSNTYAGDPDLRRAIEVLDAATAETRPDRSESRVHKLERRLSPEFVAQIVADYEAGLSSIRLMQKYGLGKGSVLKLLREAGVTIRRPGPQPHRL